MADVLRFERELLDHLRRNTSILTDIATTGLLSKENESALETHVDDYVSTFLAGQGTGLSTTSTIEGGGDAEIEVEQIVTQRSSKNAKK